MVFCFCIAKAVNLGNIATPGSLWLGLRCTLILYDSAMNPGLQESACHLPGALLAYPYPLSEDMSISPRIWMPAATERYTEKKDTDKKVFLFPR